MPRAAYWHLPRDRQKTGVDLIEGGNEQVDGEVGSKHCSLHTEDADRITHHRPLQFRRPAVSRHTEARDFQHDVSLGGQQLHCVPPAGEAFWAAVGWQTRVVDDNGGARKIASKIRCSIEVPPGGLQVEVESVIGEQGKALAPLRTVHGAGHAASGVAPPGRGFWFMAHALDQGKRGLLFEHISRVVAVEPKLGHHGVGQAMPSGHFVHPSQLADGIAAVPFGFDVHGLDDVEAAAVATVVSGQIGLADRRDIAVAEPRHRLVAEPRMRLQRKIPDVVVRISDRQLHFSIGHRHG